MRYKKTFWDVAEKVISITVINYLSCSVNVTKKENA